MVPSDRDLDTSNSKATLGGQRIATPNLHGTDRSLFAKQNVRNSDLSYQNKESSNPNSAQSFSSFMKDKDDLPKPYSPPRVESRIGDPPALQPYYKLVKREVDQKMKCQPHSDPF